MNLLWPFSEHGSTRHARSVVRIGATRGGAVRGGLLVGVVAVMGSVTTGEWFARAQQPASNAASTQAAAPAKTDSAKKLPPEQLQALVAPIALYPEALLAQTLVAATYPLEIIQLHQWMQKHPGRAWGLRAEAEGVGDES